MDEYRITNKKEPSIFKPNKTLFKYIIVDGNKKLKRGKFTEARHYVLLQYINDDQDEIKEEKFEKWELCLIKILLEINLSSYYGGIVKKLGEKTMLEELFTRVYKEPVEFLLELNNEGRIKLMAHFLSKYFKTAEIKAISLSFRKLYKHFQTRMQIDASNYRKIEEHLKTIVSSFTKVLNGIKNEVETNTREVFQCEMARKFISSYCCRYEIKKVPQKRAESTEKAYLYKIKFKDNPKWKVTSEEQFKINGYILYVIK